MKASAHAVRICVSRHLVASASLERGSTSDKLTAGEIRAGSPRLPITIPVSSPTGAVFLSYASEDSEAAARIAQTLESNKACGDAPAHALFHLLCGDVDQGADWTEKAIEERDLAILVYLRFALGKDLRESHRWPRIATMLNLEAIPQQPDS